MGGAGGGAKLGAGGGGGAMDADTGGAGRGEGAGAGAEAWDAGSFLENSFPNKPVFFCFCAAGRHLGAEGAMQAAGDMERDALGSGSGGAVGNEGAPHWASPKSSRDSCCGVSVR